jgi:hypothetical protein
MVEEVMAVVEEEAVTVEGTEEEEVEVLEVQDHLDQHRSK